MHNNVPCAIVGDGNVARHFAKYLELSGVPFKQWSRKLTSHHPVADFLQECQNVFLLIKDDAIQTFVEENPGLKHKNLYHFSGSLYCKEIPSLHPLMTFSGPAYSLQRYQSIPFVHEKGQKSFTEILPQLSNPCYPIDPLQKSLYHSLLVLSGNGGILLWQKALSDFMSKLNLKPEILHPYMQVTFDNLINHPELALTGPLVRQDKETIKRNIEALEDDTFKDVYIALAKSVGGVH